MPTLLTQLIRPQVSRVRWWIWFAATVVLIAWGVEWLWLGRAGFVSHWLVPIAFVTLVLSFFLDRRFWRPPIPVRNTRSRIVIIGAGPAGLSAAWFLRLQGYREVVVLEKLGHPGGLCRTITEDYFSIDLGANYVTPAYVETMKLADEVGADLYVERPFTTIDFTKPASKPQFASPWKAVLQDQPPLKFIGLCLKYLWLRFRLRSVIDPPGHAAIHRHPELCVPFSDWLAAHGLQPLQRLFEAPITVMGYGYLDEIAAPYALKYMTLGSFASLALKAFPLSQNLSPWPKRFVYGFQRLWEAISWNLNVRYNVTIHSIDRSDQGVTVKFSHEEQILDSTEGHEDTMHFDYLIFACPIGPALQSLADFSQEERDLFKKVQTYSYCLTSFTTKHVQMPHPIAAALPLPEMGKPWAITQQFPDSNVFQFYSRVPTELLEAPDPQTTAPCDGEGKPESPTAPEQEQTDPVRGHIVKEVLRTIERLGGSIDKSQWHTYDRWSYFPHVKAQDIRDGFFERVEQLQGRNRTYYAGAMMNFELVECSIAYSRQLVNRLVAELER